MCGMVCTASDVEDLGFLGSECWQIEVGERLLLFGAESFLFQFAIQKFKDQDL